MILSLLAAVQDIRKSLCRMVTSFTRSIHHWHRQLSLTSPKCAPCLICHGCAVTECHAPISCTMARTPNITNQNYSRAARLLDVTTSLPTTTIRTVRRDRPIKSCDSFLGPNSALRQFFFQSCQCFSCPWRSAARGTAPCPGY